MSQMRPMVPQNRPKKAPTARPTLGRRSRSTQHHARRFYVPPNPFPAGAVRLLLRPRERRLYRLYWSASGEAGHAVRRSEPQHLPLTPAGRRRLGAGPGQLLQGLAQRAQRLARDGLGGVGAARQRLLAVAEAVADPLDPEFELVQVVGGGGLERRGEERFRFGEMAEAGVADADLEQEIR